MVGMEGRAELAARSADQERIAPYLLQVGRHALVVDVTHLQQLRLQQLPIRRELRDLKRDSRGGERGRGER